MDPVSDPATVVDSSLENGNAIEPLPVEDLLESTPAAADVDGGAILDELEPVETTPATAAATATTDADKIAALGKSVGYDLSRFKTVEAAQAAADMVYERFANLGGNGDIAAALDPGAETEVKIEDEDLGLDEATTDPAILAAFKKLNGRNVELQKKMVEKAKADSLQQRQNIVSGIQSQAEGFLDGLQADTFGKAGQRTAAQSAKAEVVHKIAMKAVTGLVQEARRSGNAPNLSMNDVMDWAVKTAGFAVEKKPAAAAAVKKQFALPPKSPTAGKATPSVAGKLRVPEANDPQGRINSKDPNVQAIWVETLRRINT